MRVPLWEWAVAQDSGSGPVGVSMTRHGAMQALSQALIRVGRPSRGWLAQVKLIRPVDREPWYLRGFPERTANFDGEVIRWE